MRPYATSVRDLMLLVYEALFLAVACVCVCVCVCVFVCVRVCERERAQHLLAILLSIDSTGGSEDEFAMSGPLAQGLLHLTRVVRVGALW